MSEEKPWLDVQLVTYNSAKDIESCLASLRAQTYTNWKLLVLDNASQDESLVAVERFARGESRVIKIQSERENLGFARAHNFLLKAGQAPYVFILTADVVLAPNYFESLVESMEDNVKIGSASGLLLRSESTKSLPLVGEAVIDSAGLRLFSTHRVVELERGQPAGRREGEEAVFGVPATAAMYRRKALASIALTKTSDWRVFDPLFETYKEDVDVAYRLALRGWESKLIFSAVAYHVRAVRGEADDQGKFGSTRTPFLRRTVPKQLRYWSYRNHLYILFGTAVYPRLSVLVLTLLYEKGKALILLFTDPGMLLAWREVVRNWSTLHAKRKTVRRAPFHPENVTRFL